MHGHHFSLCQRSSFDVAQDDPEPVEGSLPSLAPIDRYVFSLSAEAVEIM
jgi:hypothetical protein